MIPTPDTPFSGRIRHLLVLLLLPAVLILSGVDGCTADSDDDGPGTTEDADGDGFNTPEDCDDHNPEVNPDAEETCNQRDDDCDGEVDEGLPTTTWFPDEDGDGFGADDSFVTACDPPEGYVETGGDCNDLDSTFYPGAPEDDCTDPGDYNCDGQTDYADTDQDGFVACEECDDQNAAVHPGAEELCNAIDDDCDNTIDEDQEHFSWYIDRDGDGYGTLESIIEACQEPEGYALEAGDCNDRSALVSPGAPEICDGEDNNCNSTADEGAVDAIWRPDNDGDGFGDLMTASCVEVGGYISVTGDCDDLDDAVYPSAPDPDDDGADQDCGGTTTADPHVGLSQDSLTSIQDAIDTAPVGATIWVGPGTYLEHDLTFAGKAATLASTHGAEAIVIDAQSQGSVMVFDTGEKSGTVVRGFALTGGYAERGAGVKAYLASPVLEHLIITENHATIDGGGFKFGG